MLDHATVEQQVCTESEERAMFRAERDALNTQAMDLVKDLRLQREGERVLREQAEASNIAHVKALASVRTRYDLQEKECAEACALV